MASIIESLIKQVPPPKASFQPSDDDWRAAEERLGLGLPEDYKRIVETYGDFYWSEFLYVLNPFSEGKYLNLFSRSEMILDAERTTRERFPEYYPLGLYPDEKGLLPFFVTDNGDTGFWITKGAPDHWAILIKDARAPEFEVHFIRTATFLYQFTGGRFRSLILPKMPLGDEDKI